MSTDRFQASMIGEHLFKIDMENEYDRDDEMWEFVPGDVVSVELRTLSGGEVLVAIGK